MILKTQYAFPPILDSDSPMETVSTAKAVARTCGNTGRDSIQIRKRIFLEKSSDFTQSSEQNILRV